MKVLELGTNCTICTTVLYSVLLAYLSTEEFTPLLAPGCHAAHPATTDKISTSCRASRPARIFVPSGFGNMQIRLVWL